MHSYTDDPEAIFRYDPWFLENEDKTVGCELSVVTGQRQGSTLVAQLAGYDDRNQAAELVGATIWVSEDRLPRLRKGEYYWRQLIGLDVMTLQGESLGVVDHLMETGANDVLVVVGTREILLPYIPSVIREVDLQRGAITVDWDPGD